MEIFKFTYAGDCADWVVSETKEQAEKIFKEFVPEEEIEKMVVMSREQFFSSLSPLAKISDEHVDYCFRNAPCHMWTTEM